MVEPWMIHTLIFMFIVIFCSFCSLMIGYWMGRNSAERPFRSELVQRRPKEQGPKDEPEEGDIFRIAMEPEEEEERIPTTT
jgi:hypothetical protein